MLIIKRITLLPINCYYGILVLAKNKAVLISIPRYKLYIFGISPNTNSYHFIANSTSYLNTTGFEIVILIPVILWIESIRGWCWGQVGS